MIKRWYIKNFKSFREPSPIELAEINVLAGANSSGKSSIIQSILLLKQTVQYGAENRSIALNGPILRLGAFEDVRNMDAINEALEIGLDIEISEGEHKANSGIPWTNNLRRQWSSIDSAPLREISLKLAFQQKDESQSTFGPVIQQNTLTPRLGFCALSTVRFSEAGDKQESFIKLIHRETTSIEDDDFSAAMGPYEVLLDEYSKQELCSDRPSATIRGGFVKHFMPSWIIVGFNAAARRAMRIADALFDTEYSMLRTVKFPDEPISDRVLEVIRLWINEQGDESPALNDDDAKLLVNVRKSLEPYVRKSNIATRRLVGGLIKSDEKLNAALAELRNTISAIMVDESIADFDYEV